MDEFTWNVLSVISVPLVVVSLWHFSQLKPYVPLDMCLVCLPDDIGETAFASPLWQPSQLVAIEPFQVGVVFGFPPFASEWQYRFEQLPSVHLNTPSVPAKEPSV